MATSIAAEGLRLPARLVEHVVDTAEGRAEAIVRLHNDAAANAAAAEVSLELMRADSSAARVDALLRQIVGPVLRRWYAANGTRAA